MCSGPVVSVFGETLFYRETWDTRRGGRHVAKRSTDPRQAFPEVKLQGRELVRAVGIFAPFAPTGRYPGKTLFIAPQGRHGPRRRAPGSLSRSTPRVSRANFGVWTVWVFVLSRNIGYNCRHVAKCSSEPRQDYPEVKLQGRDLVRVVGIVAPFAPLGVSTRGKFILSSPGGKWAQETYAGCP